MMRFLVDFPLVLAPVVELFAGRMIVWAPSLSGIRAAAVFVRRGTYGDGARWCSSVQAGRRAGVVADWRMRECGVR
jgi:hypothetical protein